MLKNSDLCHPWKTDQNLHNLFPWHTTLDLFQGSGPTSTVIRDTVILAMLLTSPPPPFPPDVVHLRPSVDSIQVSFY